MPDKPTSQENRKGAEAPVELSDTEAKDVVGGGSIGQGHATGSWESQKPVDRSGWPAGSGE